MTEGYPVLEKKMKELGITKGKVGIDMMAFDTVSYTHLDVYKRQS